MKYVPKAYQTKAIKWLLATPAAGLFLSVGLGKTSVVLAAIKVLLANHVIDKVLVIAPLHVCHRVWPNEIEKWDAFSHLSYTVLHGPDKAERLKDNVDIYIINYDGLAWLERQKGWQWPDMLVCDESSRLKGSRTQRFKMLKPHLPHFSRRVILTGTPIPNTYLDLFGQLFVLDLGERLGRYITHYRTKFFIPTGYLGYEWRLLPEAESVINDRIGDICLRLDAKDHLKLPSKIETTIELDLPPKARKLYDKLEEEFIIQLDDKVVLASNAATLSGKLRQVGNGAVYTLSDPGAGREYKVIHDEKLDALESLLEEIGQPTLVTYEFRSDLERLLKKWPRAGVLGGGVSQKKASATIDAWNRGEVPVLFLHPASAGHGLNLQEGGSHLIFFGLTWSLELHQQTIGRIHRMGQKRKTWIYYITVKDSMDQPVLSALSRKRKTQNALLDALKKWRKGRK